MRFEEFLKSEENQDNLHREVLDLARKNPNFVYNTSGYGLASCKYDGPCFLGELQVGPDCTGCIFGQAAQSLGVIAFPDSYIQDILQDSSKYLEVWDKTQFAQDNGESWGNLIPILESV